ncbi:MAG: asparagine synthase (glutamine-hydrolyzing) [Acetobacterales bacterium]
MCGIAGILTADGSTPDPGAVEALVRALGHRGPDGLGRHSAPGLEMVQTRLAIIDLHTGDQPFIDGTGNALIANGEIYNYRELRDELPDMAFGSRSDCEPPLHIYRRDGLDYTQRLRGMYAIAIHDRAEGRLVISRDPFGIKPLYYVASSTCFAFASEPQALISAGLASAEVDPAAREELLQLQFVSGERTLFRDIRRVLPGETIVVSGGRIVARRRDPALPPGGPVAEKEAEAMERLDDALLQTVELHQRADVDYGMFLSGGVDSATLLALMARLNDRPVHAFTAGFDHPGATDERAHAAAVARAAGARHEEVLFGESDFWALLPRVAAALDDPAADYATLPTFKLAERAAGSLKVILSGEGGDELFAGYGRYRSAMRPGWLGGRAMRRRGILDDLGLLREKPRAWRDGVVSAEVAAALPGRSRLQIAQATDVADWLPHDLLIKLDRCLMAHGIEGRAPFVDIGLAQAVFRLPDRLKVRGNLGKWLLRRWLEKCLPEAQPFERKRGFTVPVTAWIGERGDRIGPMVAAQPGIAEVCWPEKVEALFRNTGKRVGFAQWVLLFYALWHQHHVAAKRADGDVFAMLSTGS